MYVGGLTPGRQDVRTNLEKKASEVNCSAEFCETCVDVTHCVSSKLGFMAKRFCTKPNMNESKLCVIIDDVKQANKMHRKLLVCYLF
jgi:hypothetical protein